jgi:hypothetical protein
MCARLNTGIGMGMEDADRGEDSGYAGCDSGRALDREEGRTVDGMHEGSRLPPLKKRKQERSSRDSRIHPYEDDVPPRRVWLISQGQKHLADGFLVPDLVHCSTPTLPQIWRLTT